ncbi:MAG: oligosaccharide flippase family protein [Planctomycetes bacterium]|nr:oligosaccharide flippase family protein [Planctomycetota bacterium]
MTEEFQANSNNSKPDEKTGEDLTGQDRLISNVLFSWVAHFVFIIAGFIMPRMIDRHLGQDLLGVWDFAWSLVSYFGLVQMGIGSSVLRYVARYRANGDILGVNRIVSSSFCVLAVAGMLMMGLTIAIALLLPQLLGSRLGNNVLSAQWVVFFLGTSTVIEISFGVFSAVLTGCHRWVLHNIIKSGWHAAAIAGMILVLLRGGSLPSLALIHLTGIVLAYTTRVILAHRICQGLRLQLSLVGWATIKKLFVFGGKTLLPTISKLLLNQTTNILIIAYLGPASLALYARPQSLIRHIETLVLKMSMVLSPTTSSLHSTGNYKEIQTLLIKSVRYSFYLVLPMILMLVVFGGPILQLWMGSRYANGLIPAILAAGYLTTMVQAPVLKILGGMNAHGRAGIAHFIASLCSVGLIVLVLWYLEWGIAWIAVAVTLPLTVVNLVYIPFLICRQVDLSIVQYFLSVGVGPAIHVLPFVFCLVLARNIFRTEPLVGLAWGGGTGSIVLGILYWQYVLPKKIRIKIKRNLHFCNAS